MNTESVIGTQDSSGSTDSAISVRDLAILKKHWPKLASVCNVQEFD